jgi:purine-binding chemotaxis protein CheW
MNRDPQEIQLACFRLGAVLFGVDIMRIKEIILPRKLSPLPTPSGCLDGVISLRGDHIPVMNLARRFGMHSSGSADSARLLIVRYSGMVLGLAVDDVIEVMTVPVGEIKPPPDMDASAYEYVLGVCLSGESIVMILDIDALRDPVDLDSMPSDEKGA